MRVFEKIKRNWFLVGIVLVIILAEQSPDIGAKGGLLKPEITVKYIAVSVIFFISGISLKLEDLTGAVFQVWIHCFVQLFTLVAVPLFMQVVVMVLDWLETDEWIQKGLITVSCMPPPVSSAVILTKAVGGNEAAAVFNSAFGSFLGIILTPLTLLYFLGTTTSVPLSSTFVQLSLTVVLPLFLGQVQRHVVQDLVTPGRLPFSNIGQAMLLLIIYTTFCDTFKSGNLGMDMKDFIAVVVIVILLQIFLLFITFFITRSFPQWYSPADTIAIMFCATHKSLTLGIPILKLLFSGYSHLSQISLPLLVYHPTQILLGGMFVPHLRTWLHSSSSARPLLVTSFERRLSYMAQKNTDANTSMDI